MGNLDHSFINNSTQEDNKILTTTKKMADYTIAEYVWIDADGGLRCKARVIRKPKVTLKDLPDWNFDGSSTGQAPGEDSEVIIKPAAMFKDPFRGGNHVLVMTDCYTPQGVPIPTNTRHPAAQIFSQKKEEIPWFGIEQEYTLFKGGVPLGWPVSSARTVNFGPTMQIGYPGPQGPYYCAAGADVTWGRDLVEEHLQMCLDAGINISGINAEVMPGQWEYQVGPCIGIDSGDHMWMSRYILNRVAEKYGIVVSLDPKPIPGDWNGAGCHTNFSTETMRKPGGYKKAIIPAIEKLAKKHQIHIEAYGEGNERRLTGGHETASISQFSWGVANRGASVRVGNQTKEEGKGYFEDRRPASNMDPYVVTSLIFQTTTLE